MIPFLANYIAPPGTGNWLSIAFYIVGLAAAVVVLWKQVSPSPIRPQPLQVSGTVRMATHDELKQLRDDIDEYKKEAIKRFEKIEHKIDFHYKELIEKGEDRKEEIFVRLNNVIDKYNESHASDLKEIFNELGKLDGRVQGLKKE